MYAGVYCSVLAATFLFVVIECRWDFNENDIRAKTNDRESDTAEKRYTSSWAVEITEGGDNMADETAARYGFRNLGKVDGLHNVYHFELNSQNNSPNKQMSTALKSEHCVGFAEQQIFKPRVRKSYDVPEDPLFPYQWNLVNTGQYGNEYRGNDLKVEQAWLQGVSGCNVTVTVVDDGLYYPHRDLWDNYVDQTSYDFVDEDKDPSNQYPWHGTSCGGIIGAVKDEETCGLGIAYNCNLGGIALLGRGTDINEARSLTYANSIVDIYSNSWGPRDDGVTIDGPGYFTRSALQSGANEGRDGKGSIFVWANGNGGNDDDCAADGYTQNIYSISVGAIGVDGAPSPFDEQCSAKMVVAYVTDPNGYSSVRTTALRGCTYRFGGTSAATPMVSGIIALALEANNALTWRDVQYLIVYTSNPALTNTVNYDTTVNGAGLQVSRDYGFGVIDAEAMVSRARHWINVPPQLEQIITPATDSGIANYDSPFTTTILYNGTLHYLEHVVVQMTLNTSPVGSSTGDIGILLVSPFGTHSVLLGFRPRSPDGYDEWPFMSVMFWGEDPNGEWNLTVISGSSFTEVEVSNVTFQFFGVSQIPESVANIPTECHPNCSRGCAGEGSDFCDACVNLRNAYTLECIDSCPPGYTERNGYCYNSDKPTEECNSHLKETKTSGSCVDAGYVGCCVDEYCGVTAENISYICFCDAICHKLGDCCYDISLIDCSEANSTEAIITLPIIEPGTTGSCVDAGIVECCDHCTGSGGNSSCFCDAFCYTDEDCCYDISLLNCTEAITAEATIVLPYIELGIIEAVETQSLPTRDDYVSDAINIEFPFGGSYLSAVYVATDGYFSLDGYHYLPFIPTHDDIIIDYPLVAPYWTDSDVTVGIGSIDYEIHTSETSQHILSSVDSIINEHMQTEFHGEWILLAEWNNVPQYGGIINFTNTFQGILATDFVRSFAVFTYLCGDLSYSANTIIGFYSDDGLYALHPASDRLNAMAIACLNYPDNPWVNVVYELTAGMCSELSSPVNGEVTWTGLTTGSTATYTCDSDYQLTGDQTRTCLNTGIWSGRKPTCTLEEVDFPFRLQPTVIDGLENCGPSYTADAVNEIDRNVEEFLMELFDEQNDRK